ncbi:MAG: asparagine synthase (glutamine-hydrolyzing) [Rickettsiales bacterium]|nr:asparagine synthase (glutamine-hydrolyzing) [Rickettsiales bacterium]
MCGIAGLFGNINDAKKQHLTNVFNDALLERGPDGFGEYYEQNIFLFHRRLSIIDLESGGQPLYFHDEKGSLKYVLIVNGEIYNYLELRQEFDNEIFKTKSDCEVILHLFDKYKANFTQKLRGMYAIALYDVQKSRLILSRDNYGIKPLYYSMLDNAIIFASNLTAITNSKILKKELLPEKAYELLQARFGLSKQTIFRNIFRLLPGETLVFENNQIVNKITHNAIDLLLLEGKKKSFDPNTLTAQISDSTAMHLRSDVPVGLFFSGGVDSSVILYWMKQLVPHNIHLFIAGFPESEEHDETSKALKAISGMGFNIHKVEFTEDDFWKYLVKTAKCLDDPLIDPASLPTYKLSEVAKEHVKVVLCGEGGDEFFSGYRRHHKAGLFGGIFKRRHSLKGLFRDSSLFAINFQKWQQPIDDDYKQINDFPWTRLQKMQIIDSSFWLPNNLLTKLDRCTMANSIEGRTPFIDQTLSPYALSIPNKYKVKFKYAKWCLRQHLDTYFKQANAFGKKKGFKLPVYQWLNNQRPFLIDYLCNHEAFADLFNHANLANFITQFTKKNETAIFGLIFYSLWYDYHIKGKDLEVDNDLIVYINS